MVLATATPKTNGPKKLATAVIARATRGDSARDEIMVATTLLESWIPFRKSKIRAKTITAIMIGDMLTTLQLGDLDHDVGDHVGSLIPTIRRVAQVTVNLA